MNWILLAVVGVALLCPITMFGPMLLERLGLRKTSGGGMSCMGMMPGGRKSQDQQRRDLIARRDEVDAEIARVESQLGGGVADEPPPHASTPHSTRPV